MIGRKKGLRLVRLGKYDIKEEIGRGSMGTVYRGYDPFINRDVAIKVALMDLSDDRQQMLRYRRMFFNEARIAGMLEHKNIIRVYDAGMESNYYYLVMEYIKGAGTLKDYCKPQSLLPIEKSVEIIFNCCNALDYAHGIGIIHRDIKPGNIMLTEDMEVKLGDFGIAQIIKTDATQVGGLMGSPLYMSPEQVKEEELSVQTDLYSLGVVLYELLTGNPPFVADNFSSLILKIMNEEPLPMSYYRKDVPRVLEGIVARSMKKNVQERYPKGEDFSADLGEVFRQLKQEQEPIKDQDKFDALTALDFFRDFFRSELWEIIQVSSWVEYGPNVEIITEGDADDFFYILLSGEAAVKKYDKILTTLKSGDCFGEMAYLSGSVRTASVVSLTQSALLKVKGALVDKTSLQCQIRFNKAFLRILIYRLSRTSEELARLSPGRP
ncbi:MAG: protein kinase [Nitrospirae bacterium]|nr:protein kinase [Nitrospirota bacterium]